MIDRPAQPPPRRAAAAVVTRHFRIWCWKRMPAARSAAAGLLTLLAAMASGCWGGGAPGARRGGAAADGPLPPGGATVIEWRPAVPQGEQVLIDAGGFWLDPVYPAPGPRAHYLFAHYRRGDELARWARDLAPFREDAAGGVLVFRGRGPAPADAALRRMIGEWSRQVVWEAGGNGGASPYGLALSWHRGAATEGACDDLEVFLSGEVRAGTCGGPGTVQGRLSGERLQRLYAWIDALRPLQDSGDAGDSRVRSDALLERLVFAGRGPRPASRDEVAALEAFAAALHHELEAARALPPPAAAGAAPAGTTPQAAPPPAAGPRPIGTPQPIGALSPAAAAFAPT
jgi:hypothetical protein